MQGEDLSGIASAFVGQVSVGELDVQSLREPGTSEVGAMRSVLVEVV